jgi:hypothetical protein
MIRIAITSDAFEAVATTLPLDSVARRLTSTRRARA